jgi:hypothetical protein
MRAGIEQMFIEADALDFASSIGSINALISDRSLFKSQNNL